MEIKVTSKDTITIKADKIKNKYQTLDVELFPVTAVQEEGNELTIPAEMLLESMKRVAYAVPAQGKTAVMMSMCLQAEFCWIGWACIGMGQGRLRGRI